MKTASIREQYDEAQARHPGMVILMRTGDTYEAFGGNAEKVALTGQPVFHDLAFGKTSFHARHIEQVLRVLLREGNRVAVAEIAQ